MTRISLSARSARALLANRSIREDFDPALRRAREELEAALKPKRSKAPARARREAKRKTKRELFDAIKRQVFARSGGKCELCGVRVASDPHHVFGRVRVPESVSNVIAVCRRCHDAITQSKPSAAHWQREQIHHLEAYGYTEEARRMRALLESESLIREAEATR